MKQAPGLPGSITVGICSYTNKAFKLTISAFTRGLTAVCLVALSFMSASMASAAEEYTVPHFEVDAYWLQPLTNHCVFGAAFGVGMESALTDI